MSLEYAYPEQFGWVIATQRVMLVFVVAIFFVPVVREVVRRGPMNWIDLALGAISLTLCMTLPVEAEQRLIAVIQSERQLELDTIIRILRAAYWYAVPQVAGFGIGVHGFWLLTCWVKEHKILKTTLVYAIPMVWLSIPALAHPRYIFDKSQCINNVKQIGLAMHNYHDKENVFPPSTLDTAGTSRTWRVELLPYLDHAPLRNRYDVTAAWNAPPNASLAERKVVPLLCPGNYRPRDVTGRYLTAYAGVIGPHMFFADDGSTRTKKDFTDGTSNTIAIVEACGAQIVWTEPRDLQLSGVKLGVNLPGPQPGTSRGVISSCHFPTRGGHALFVDGSVRFVNEKIPYGLMMDLLTADGGEVIPYDDNREIR